MSGYSYSEACRVTVTKAEVIRELLKHGATVAEFAADCGDYETYLGQTVLDWLGY